MSTNNPVTLEQAAFLQDICKLVPFASGLGFTVTAGEFLSTPYQQAEYVRTGLSKTQWS